MFQFSPFFRIHFLLKEEETPYFQYSEKTAQLLVLFVISGRTATDLFVICNRHF